MDAPQLPGVESSTGADGGLPPGQASAFRRALDAQVESAGPGLALVPSGPHDLTRPIDVNALRAALTGSQASQQPRESVPGFPEAAPGLDAGAGAAVVMPSVSVPSMRGPTTLATPSPKSVAAHGGGINGGSGGTGKRIVPTPPAAPAAGKEHENENEHEHSPRHSGGSGKQSRLPTTIGLSLLLAAIAATALVLIDVGRSSGPLAPSAMPTKSAPPSAAAAPPHSATPSHRPSPSASHSPSHSAAPSPSAAKASPSPSTVANFATIRWTSDYSALVADIQSRLAKLRYLTLNRNGSQYDVSQRTMFETGNRWWQPSDQVGYYQNATTSAIRAFKSDYLQHNQDQSPNDGSCDTATYQALVNATS